MMIVLKFYLATEFIQLNGVYQINIGDAQKFEADFRAAEEAMRIPPDNWAHLEYRGTGNS